MGDALEGKAYIGGALLSLVGYVLYSEVQRLNTAHEAQREMTETLRDMIERLSSSQQPGAGAQVTPEALVEKFREALRDGEEVDFAVIGFTGETFAPPLKQLLGSLPRNSDRKVNVRVLVPDFAQEIQVPGLIRADGKVTDAVGFRRYLVQQISGYEAELKRMKGRMQHHGQGRLSIEFRVMHMSPSLKLYLINSDQVFEGIYDKIELRPDEYSSDVREGDQLLDLIGHDSLLTHWHRDDGRRAREIIDRRRTFFDTLWNAAHGLPANSLTGDPNGSSAAS
ncbi:ATP/GTP-binding protein [Streptomyces griseus]|uniref:ATP/GTP-binding protein n=1 Tax=Streptomyces griseus TaxID=1911 RepID=UPI001F2A15CD|nr:ATP/GTP-binding protein [Streptomyces griseus]